MVLSQYTSSQLSPRASQFNTCPMPPRAPQRWKYHSSCLEVYSATTKAKPDGELVFLPLVELAAYEHLLQLSGFGKLTVRL